MNPRILAIDFDGVIADSDKAKLIFAREELGLQVSESQLKHRYFVEIFGEKQGTDLYRRIIRTIYHSERMLTVPLVPGASEGLAALQQAGWEYVVITSRDGSPHEEGSSAYCGWKLMEQKGIHILKRDFINVNESSKLAACLSRGAYGLMDDDYSKLIDVIAGGLTGFLFSTQTNRCAEKEYHPFLANRVNGWSDLVSALKKIGH